VYIAAVHEKNSGGSSVKYYALLDHLGSTLGLTNAAGASVGAASYWPYGAVRAATGVLGALPATDRLYTGQREEAGGPALGLYNYRARFYSTTLGRFVSADPPR